MLTSRGALQGALRVLCQLRQFSAARRVKLGQTQSTFKRCGHPVKVDQLPGPHFGYRFMGLRVPLVMTTLWNLANTGRIASDASRQLRGRAGLGVKPHARTHGPRKPSGPRFVVGVMAWHRAASGLRACRVAGAQAFLRYSWRGARRKNPTCRHSQPLGTNPNAPPELQHGVGYVGQALVVGLHYHGKALECGVGVQLVERREWGLDDGRRRA